jgi:hypothetical protein
VSKKPDGGPAFPRPMVASGSTTATMEQDGMSLRDYFAAQAIEIMVQKSEDAHGGWSEDTVAVGAYAIADAMIEARKQ